MTNNIENIIATILSGDDRAKTRGFATIFNEFHPKVIKGLQMNFGLQFSTEEIEDIAMEVMNKVCSPKYLKTWEPKFKFASWVSRITYNQAIDHLRKGKDKEDSTMSLTELSAMSSDSESDARHIELTVEYNTPEKAVLDEELGERIMEAINNLSEKNREIAELYFIQQLNDVEVEALIGMKPTTYRPAVNRVKKVLRKALLEEGVV